SWKVWSLIAGGIALAAIIDLAVSAGAYKSLQDIREKLHSAKKPESIIRDRTERLAKNPKDAAAYRDRAWAKQRLGDYEGAEADYTKAIEFDPQNAKLYAWRGYVRNVRKQFEEAIADCTRAAELDPRLTTAFSNRGYARMVLHDFQGALADYTRAI